jgi:predicted helicase
LFGFELLMAPYAIAHLKLGLALQERGFDFPPGHRLGVYLTNTLDEGIKTSEALYGPIGYIAEESNAAARIKKEDPIEVILGNPPYAGHSANASVRREVGVTGTVQTVRTFIGRLIEDYKQVDGRPLGEKNPKWLQDDYVKFLRWGQWRLTQTGQGILAMITNHGYLDNPTFRGMRQQLMQTFNEIYLLNLHGNAKKKEFCPDGSQDENVFDIQQGVAIGLFIKREGGPAPARVFYADLWGLREAKYQALAELEVPSTPWRELQPYSPYYLFVPQDTDLRAEYERGWPVNDIFPVNSVGIVTARDHLTIHWTPQEVMDTVKDFASLNPETAREKYRLGNDVRDWKLQLAQKDLQKSGLKEELVIPVLYRPFDVRFTYYTGQTRGFLCMPRPEVMRHMLAGKNLGLAFSRQNRSGLNIFVSRHIMDAHLIPSVDINYIFPLYLYPYRNRNQRNNQNSFLSLCEPESPYCLTTNVNKDFVNLLLKNLGLTPGKEGRGNLESTFGPEDVFSYAYAVFHSPTYRRRYAEFLKVDFPRLPLTGNQDLFKALVGLGAELVSLHLMESPRLETFITRFPVPGSQRVEKVRYDEAAGRVYLNAEQYFEGVPPEVWAFTIGGYQVCHKWLKDRQGRTLTFADLHHYQKIVVALAETIRLMAAIDAAIHAHGGWPLDGES